MMEINCEGLLSQREKIIVQLVVQAKCRKTIADELNVSIHTIDSHLRHIRIKTNTHSLQELIIWALNLKESNSD